MSEAARTVEAFAAALDREDYIQARKFLARDCVYDSPEGEIRGPSEIIKSYLSHGTQAKTTYDAVDYSHHAAALSAGHFVITFCDMLRISDRSHTFRCQQHIHLEGNRIVRIVHRELPAERAALEAFKSIRD